VPGRVGDEDLEPAVSGAARACDDGGGDWSVKRDRDADGSAVDARRGLDGVQLDRAFDRDACDCDCGDVLRSRGVL
jgi:hypothetical protein